MSWIEEKKKLAELRKNEKLPELSLMEKKAFGELIDLDPEEFRSDSLGEKEKKAFDHYLELIEENKNCQSFSVKTNLLRNYLCKEIHEKIPEPKRKSIEETTESLVVFTVVTNFPQKILSKKELEQAMDLAKMYNYTLILPLRQSETLEFDFYGYDTRDVFKVGRLIYEIMTETLPKYRIYKCNLLEFLELELEDSLWDVYLNGTRIEENVLYGTIQRNTGIYRGYNEGFKYINKSFRAISLLNIDTTGYPPSNWDSYGWIERDLVQLVLDSQLLKSLLSAHYGLTISRRLAFDPVNIDIENNQL